MHNPLFPTDANPDDAGFVLPTKSNNLTPIDSHNSADAAADVIRQKLAKIYADEPDAKAELAEAEAARPMSPHQRFMHDLSTSGKDLATIQTEWHNYYLSLPSDQKQEVWQEFYESNAVAQSATPVTSATTPAASADHTERLAAHKNQVVSLGRHKANRHTPQDNRSPADIRTAIRHKVSASGKLQTRHHVQSLIFGLGLGMLVVFIFLFGFFNEAFIAPFIQPSRTAVAAPVILSSDSITPTSTPEVIIPKINVEIPVDYSQNSTDETVIENALQSGIVHYPTTTLPGQTGNTAFFGHSSNNIFAAGKYKFAFALLHELVPGDVFYLTYNSKVYAYKVFSKTIVQPTDVGVLNPVDGHTATATLITCDPPGTSWRRLVVVGDQISPDPGTNSTGSTLTSSHATVSTILPGNGQTMWSRWWGSTYGKIITVTIIIASVVWRMRRFKTRATTAR